MDLSISDAHNHPRSVFKQVEKGSILIWRWGKIMGVMISPEESKTCARS